jgi:DNA-binding transcriptional LysR family regulator
MLHNRNMILDGIDVFVRVVQEGSFAAAARHLGMPTTTVSAKIARLEERLGTTLIQRSTRRMHVTEAGQAYFASCVEALNALTAGESRLAAAGGKPSGLLRITAASDIASTVLPPFCETFLAAYPEASIDLVVTNRQVDLIGEGIDLAVRAGPMRDSTLMSRKFACGALGLWASADYVARRGAPTSPEDLAADHEVVGFSRVPESFRLLGPKGATFLLPEKTRLRVDDMQAIRGFVLRGFGIGLLPDVVTPGTSLVRILPEYSTEQAHVYFVYPAQRHLSPNVRVFMDMARDMADQFTAAAE